jgi:hypothetical protein
MITQGFVQTTIRSFLKRFRAKKLATLPQIPKIIIKIHNVIS